MHGGSGIEADLDEVFAADPSAFVGVRDALARRLRREGDKEAAAEVAGLRRPTAVAWALNQLSRREGRRIGVLFEKDERLRELTRSGGRGPELRKATEERREIVRDLAKVASAILAAGGYSPSQAANDRIFETLQAVATDSEAREALRLGRLSGDVRPSGFGEGWAIGPTPAGTGPEAAAGAGAAGEQRRVREAEAAQVLLSEARRTARDLAGEAEEAARSADRLARDAGEADRRARQARKQADRAAADAERARAAADQAVRRVSDLEGDAG